jgi:hypothetical protein
MARSKDNQAMAPAPEESKAPAPEESKPAVPEEQPGPKDTAPPKDPVPGAEESKAPTPPAPAPAQVSKPELFSLEELAEANRVPGWQSAALHKLMGWEPGKRVTENVYKAGLARLKTRRIGG